MIHRQILATLDFAAARDGGTSPQLRKQVHISFTSTKL